MNKNVLSKLCIVAFFVVSAVALYFMTATLGAAPEPVASAAVGRDGGGGGGAVYSAFAGSSVAFSGRLDRQAVLAGQDGRVKMELVLRASERPDEVSTWVPSDVIVILDRSGSMTGEKIEQARAAVTELIERLAPRDRLALVTYASDAELEIPLAAATVEARRLWLARVAALASGGGTNMSSGLDLALATLQVTRTFGRASRLLLLSDGRANEGDPSFEGLTARAARAAQGEALVSTIGVGVDFNEVLMTAMADAGTGNYYFLEHPGQLAQIFNQELDASRTTVASAIEVEIEPAAGVTVVDAGGYPLEHRDGRTTFRPGSLFAGQERRIWVTLAVAAPKVSHEAALGRFSASFREGEKSFQLAFSQQPRVALVQEEEKYFEAFDKETWERSVLQEDYNQLQQTVAAWVRQGRRDEALREISAYRADTESVNAQVGSAEVTSSLETLRDLEAEVEEAFVGAEQGHKQRLLSKKRQAAGLDGRRVGSKKTPIKNSGQP